MQACQLSFALAEKTTYSRSDESEDFQSDCERVERGRNAKDRVGQCFQRGLQQVEECSVSLKRPISGAKELSARQGGRKEIVGILGATATDDQT